MLKLPATDDARRLREFLADAGYSHKKFLETPALRELPVRSGNSQVLLERTAEPTVLNVLLRWFFLGLPVAATTVRACLPAPILQILLDCGLIRAEGDGFVANVMLTPCDDFYFAADPAARMQSPESHDIVLWPNPTTRLLQMFAVRRPSRATLDLGAGCGIVGILAAPFSGHVTATDLNPRAGEFTLFNARLNGIEQVEYLTGDTFEPVAGRQFDLILANPPFFITPTSGQMYCETDMDLDQYCRKVVREAGRHLNEGGFFQAVMEWVQVSGQTWQERLSEWLDGTGCDAWVLRSYVRDAAGYARERIRETLPHESYSEKLESWTDYYRQRGVEEIHGGILAMRRRSGRNWLRLEGTAVEASAPFGDLVLETFETQDILNEQPGGAALLGMYPRLPEDARLDHSYRISGGKWVAESLNIRLSGAAPAHSAVQQEVAGFLSRCDGSRTLGELADELASKVRVNVEDARAQCCNVVRTLADRRILHLSHKVRIIAQQSGI